MSIDMRKIRYRTRLTTGLSFRLNQGQFETSVTQNKRDMKYKEEPLTGCAIVAVRSESRRALAVSHWVHPGGPQRASGPW